MKNEKCYIVYKREANKIEMVMGFETEDLAEAFCEVMNENQEDITFYYEQSNIKD